MIKLKRPTSKAAKFAIVIAVVAVLGVGGWYIWQAIRPQPKPQDIAQEAEVKYLNVDVFGVRLKLTPETHDAYYNSRGGSPDFRNLNARFLNPETGCNNDAVALIYKVHKDAINPSGGKKYAEVEQGKVIDNSFYFIKAGAQACPGNQDSQARLDKARADFLAATPTIEKL